MRLRIERTGLLRGLGSAGVASRASAGRFRYDLLAFFAAAMLAATTIVSAESTGENNALATPGDFRRPVSPHTGADARISAARIRLGKALFFDPRLSGSGMIACATCHDPARGWEDGQILGAGDHGARLARHTPTILNIAWSEPLFWDGRAATLEEQAKGPLSAPLEMNMPPDRLVATVRALGGYRKAFAAEFPGEPITLETIVTAIAAFERTVVSGTAPFDRWASGDARALSASAKRGFALFASTRTNCASCHSGWRFTDDGFHDIGLPDADIGRAAIMPDIPVLEHAFKTPTLRNIAERAPYMHDGSLPTLEAVLDHYSHGFVSRRSLSPEITPLKLTPQEKTDLLAFLRSLSSRDPRVTAPHPYR